MQEAQETQVQCLGQGDPLEEEMATHSGILTLEFHGQRRLAGYSQWGRKESDTIEVNEQYTEHILQTDSP